MGKEGAVDDDPQKIEKGSKSKSRKHEKNEESSTGIDESQSIGAVKEIEYKQHRRDKEKKKKKKGTKDIEEVDIEKKGVKESKSVYGDDVNDEAERKRKKREKKNKSKKLLEGESVAEVKRHKEAKKERKKQKMMAKNHKDGDIEKVEDKKDGKEVGAHSENIAVNVMGMVERKKRKREKKRSKNEANIEDFAEKTERKKKKKKSNVQPNDYDGNVTGKLEREMKKEKYKNNDKYKDNDSHETEHADKGKKKKKRIKLVDNDSVTPTPNKSNKKVRFSGEDEVFTLPSESSDVAENYGEDGLLRAKRFTPEEDEIVKEAVFKYIAENGLGEEGLNMVLNSKKHRKKLSGCWKEIGSAIPYRPYMAIYCRAQILFRRSEERKWTQEEYDLLIKYQEEHGNRWRPLADELGKHMWHVKDAWRRIKFKDRQRGHWSQSEYQKLFDLVNTDLKSKASQDKKLKHGMLRDNICWGAISDELATRTNVSCCKKWYNQLTSRMVIEGEWSDADDYRLVGALYDLDATCMEDVDWDVLVDGRSGEVCRKRWGQMVLHIGQHGLKSFGEQVEVMTQRYCPHLLELRENWDNKPRVP